MTPPADPAPGAYKPLSEYLGRRYADRIVLTFQQIEDLIGFLLPAVARSNAAWWDDRPAAQPSAQSSSWVSVSRTARVNLAAACVLFERSETTPGHAPA